MEWWVWTLCVVGYLGIGLVVLYLACRTDPDWAVDSYGDWWTGSLMTVALWPLGVFCVLYITVLVALKGKADGERIRALRKSEREELEKYRAQALKELEEAGRGYVQV